MSASTGMASRCTASEVRRAQAELELHAITVASEHEQRMQSILADYPLPSARSYVSDQPPDIAGAYKCHVQLKDPNCRPVKCKERRRSPADEAALRAATEEMLAKGLIRKSMSEWVSQPVLVKKVRDGVVLSEKRPCWDYRFANDRIRGDAFPLPLPENMFDSLRGSRLFSKLDLTRASGRYLSPRRAELSWLCPPRWV